MLQALAEGETDPAAIAALAHQRLRGTPEQLCEALGACSELNPVYRRLVKMALEDLQMIEQQIGQLPGLPSLPMCQVAQTCRSSTCDFILQPSLAPQKRT